MVRASTMAQKYVNPRTKTSNIDNPGPGSYESLREVAIISSRSINNKGGEITPRGITIGRAIRQNSEAKMSIEVPGVGTYNLTNEN